MSRELEYLPLIQPPSERFDIRFTQLEEAPHMKRWLMDPSVNRWFPMDGELEIEDAVARWISFYRYKCSLTALIEGEPCGLATLYLQPYRKLAHQCEFGVLVAPEWRNKGIGSHLINSLMHLAKKRFKIELLHLQVYAGNPAIRLYQRFGFREFGRQTHWLKEQHQDAQGHEETEFVGRLFMERFL